MNVIARHLPSFLSNTEKQHFIDGKWQPSVSGERIETHNPATGNVLATLARGREADVHAAVAAARRAFEGPWSRFTPVERHKLLMRVYEIVEKNADELTLLETLDMGGPIGRTRADDCFLREPDG
jgi:aldehyde dehydrogenase (NAD+)